jgi:hypothetical protein
MTMGGALRTTPSFFEFSPLHIPFHSEVIDLVEEYDYKKGYPEILLSGSVGSAKSILAAHIAVKHCIKYAGARLAICRRALPDIKRTIFQTIVEHLDCQELKPDKDYKVRHVNAEIEFRNGSIIEPLFWSDNRFTRIRSVPLSAAIFEEITENDEDDKMAFYEIKARIGRILHVPEKFIIAATNPDGPEHWVYRYFIGDPETSRFVFYSNTLQNPFLPKDYIEQLKKDMHPKLAERLIYGRWVTLQGERVYYGYDTQKNFKNVSYDWQFSSLPIYLCFDFNIGRDKPMSSCAFIEEPNGTFHVFKSFGIDSARTADAIDAWKQFGLFKNQNRKIIICGDATGASRDTRGPNSDWDIVKKEISNLTSNYEMKVPRSNPEVRVRQNVVNSLCIDGTGNHRLFIYKDAKLVDEGLNGTKVRRGSTYQEDDSFHAQHVVSALGYGLCAATIKGAPITFR